MYIFIVVDKTLDIPYNNTMNKHTQILTEIAAVYLPEYQGRAEELVAHHRHYNVEHIVEDAMCRIGGYTWVDQHTHDNSDYSETKTGTIRTHDSVATISNIVTDRGQVKCGDIRAVIYNQFDHSLHYYFLPKAYWESIREYGKSNGTVLRSSYNAATDTVSKWKKYRVNTFHELAQTPSTISNPHSYTALGTPKNTLFDWL